MFSSSFDMFLKDKKYGNTTISRPRKRRANSDSELTFHDSFDRQSYQDLRSPLFLPNPLHEYEDIDIMGENSNDSNHMLGSSSTMDPSQMFISSKTPDHSSTFDFPSSSLVAPASMEPVDFNPLQNDSPDVVNSINEDIPSLFSTQVFLVNPSAAMSMFQQAQNDISGVEHHNLFPLPETTNILGGNLLSEKDDSNNKPKTTTSFQRLIKPKEISNEALSFKIIQESDINKINQQWITMKGDKTLYKEQGHTWKTGLWTNEEENILKENIEQYCVNLNIKDVHATIFSTSKDERKKFYRSIAKRLNRPLFSVYRKVLRMYDKTNNLGKYTTKEVAKLKKCCKLYNKNWHQIGHELGRSGSSVKDKVRLLNNASKKGHWEEIELERLSHSVHEQTNTRKGENVTANINWVKASEDVGTRSEKQCRFKCTLKGIQGVKARLFSKLKNITNSGISNLTTSHEG